MHTCRLEICGDILDTEYWCAHIETHPVQIYERQSLLENIHQRLSAVHIGWGVLFTRRMVKVSRHDSHGTISPNQQHGNGKGNCWCKLNKLKLELGNFPKAHHNKKHEHSTLLSFLVLHPTFKHTPSPSIFLTAQ
jgi:hypothetical protein